MSLVATLISHPHKRALSSDLATSAMRALGARELNWLGENVACDIPASGNPNEIEDTLRRALAGKPIDIAVHKAEERRKKILIADMDSTMIEQECIDELAAELGLKDAVAAITRRAMNGEIAFEPALEERVALLAGLPLEIIGNVIENRITLASGAATLVATMSANGAFTALVSGGFEHFTQPIAERLGFKIQQANRLESAAGKLTGKVEKPILGRAAKAEALSSFATRCAVGVEDALAVGDGANDLDMIRLAGLGVALHAKPAVAAQAGIRIDHSDLTALLYLQGYRESEFVTS